MFRSPLTDGIVVLVILLLIVGPKKLPQLGRGLGDGMREFKEGITGEHKNDHTHETLSQAHAAPAPGTGEERAPQATAAPGREAGADRS